MDYAGVPVGTVPEWRMEGVVELGGPRGEKEEKGEERGDRRMWNAGGLAAGKENDRVAQGQ